MVKRVHMAAGRLLLSRPGFAAHPDMPHANKAFDSDWAYAGQLIAAGWADDPATPSHAYYVDATLSSEPWVIPFPECPFIPTVLLSGYYSPTYQLRRLRRENLPRKPIGLFSINREDTWRGSADPYNKQDKYRFQITRSSIIMHRWRFNETRSTRWEYAIHYQVFGFPGPDG